MTVTRAALVGLCAALLMTARGGADEAKKPADAPDAFAKKALAALKDDRIEEFAKMMHPEALKEFRGLLMTVVAAAGEKGQEKQVLALFDGAKSADDLKEFTDVKFFTAFYRTVTKLQPQLKEMLGGSEVQTLGSVAEGKDKMHVLYRMTMSVQGAKVTKMAVLSLRKTESGWGMLLDGDIEGMGAMLKQRFGEKK
jgi:hypothetical protein